MCCELSHSAFGSNGSSSLKFTTAFERLMPSKEKARQFLDGHLLAVVLGDQPSRHRKLT
jgi:hypothetical protein